MTPEIDGPKHRRVTYSPDEEFQLRCALYGPPKRLTDAEVYLLLTDVESRTITKDGIQFKPPGAPASVLYWNAASEVFNDANIGQIVRFRYDPDDPGQIYVMRADGSLWDTLPADVKPAMLDTAAQAAARARNEIPYRVARAQLDRIHAPTTAAEADRRQRNAARLNTTRTFPASVPTVDKSDAAPERPTFARGGADALDFSSDRTHPSASADPHPSDPDAAALLGTPRHPLPRTGDGGSVADQITAGRRALGVQTVRRQRAADHYDAALDDLAVSLTALETRTQTALEAE